MFPHALTKVRSVRFGVIRVVPGRMSSIALIIKAQRAGVSLRQVMQILRAASGSVDPTVRRRALARSVMQIDRLEKQRLLFDAAVGELQYICALLTTEQPDTRADERS